MRLFFISTLFVLSGFHLFGQNEQAIERSGDVLMLALPGAAFASTFVWKDDQKAPIRVIETMVVSASTTYLLKYTTNKTRPNGEPYAFPSGHTSNAFAGAGIIYKRYGWKAGIPSMLLASYTGWTRVHANKHDWWDVLGGAVVGTGSALLFTKPYQKERVLDVDLGLNSVYVRYRF